LARNLAKALADGDPAAARVSHKALSSSQGYAANQAAFSRLTQAAAAVDAAGTEPASALIAHVAAWDQQPLSNAGVVAAVEAFASGARSVEELGAFKAAAAKLSATGPVSAAITAAWPGAVDASLRQVLTDPAKLKPLLDLGQGLSSPVITAAAYNLQLATLKSDAAKAAKDSKALLGAVQTFATSQAQERAAGQWPAAAALAESLVNGAQRAAKAAGGHVSAAGPASKGWKSRVSDGGTAIFTLERGDAPVNIAFRRVDAGGGETAWVSTSEVAVGTFIEVAAANSKFDDLSSAMAKTVVGGKDMRVGPRTWTWGKAPTGGGQAMLTAKASSKDLSLGWLTGVTDLGGKAYYAPELAVAPAAPAPASPMQYVSPQAAVLWASLVGCRLPTAAEWRAASQAGEAGVSNRRDATWVTQFKHVQTLNAGGAATQWPNAAIFYPTSAPRPSSPQDAAAAVEQDDKVLWFSPVNTAAEAFEHLVGNVAEFVTESVVTDGSSDLATIEKQLKRGESVRVIGASALSPPGVDPATALSMVWTAAKEGYSDVGFRLAFTAAPAPVQESDPSGELARLIQEAKFIDHP
ncbi:MAG: SUMF1/EgtB/PvdO family nonheme iron enzyme, partial [Planctomycetota bacterium]|nr:SUMF1/EgtB/PvdO family nonheme iron enzyme [Planctomycetota bacterium]